MTTGPRRASRLFVFPLGLVILGCANDLGSLARKGLPQGGDRFARDYIDVLRNGNWAGGETLATEARTPETSAGLATIAHQLRGQLAESIALVGFRYSNTLMGSGEWQHRGSVSYQVALRDSVGSVIRYWLATVTEKDSAGKLWVVGMRTDSLAGPLERINAFSLSGKSPVHYLMLGLALLAPLCILGVEVVCLRTPIRRRWAWMLLILLATPVTSFNWTTGETHTTAFSVILLGFSWLRASVYSPAFLQWGFPMGALVFVARRYQLIVQARHTSKEGYTKLNLPDRLNSAG